MSYVYHIVSEGMKGKILFPLNTLKKKYPELYKKEKKKYEDRQSVMKRKIPRLNCFWNDVIHLTPIHPLVFRRELKKIGFSQKNLEWYKIDTELLDPKKTLIYLYKNQTHKSERLEKEQFIKFDSKKVSELKKIPKGTINYYKREFKKGKRPLLFHLVPHILYKGNLKVDKLKKIKT